MTGAPPDVTDDELLAAIHTHVDPVVTASDVAERVGLTSQAVNKRLPRLVEEGYLRKKKVGASAVVYWTTQSGRERASSTFSR